MYISLYTNHISFSLSSYYYFISRCVNSGCFLSLSPWVILYKSPTVTNNSIFVYFLLEYSCFTTLCQFLLYSKVNQLSEYIYTLFFGFPSNFSHHRALNRVRAIQQVVISYLFYTWQCYMSISISQFIPPPQHHGIHTWLLMTKIQLNTRGGVWPLQQSVQPLYPSQRTNLFTFLHSKKI